MAFVSFLVIILIIISLVLRSRLEDIERLLNEMKKELVALKNTAQQDTPDISSKQQTITEPIDKTSPSSNTIINDAIALDKSEYDQGVQVKAEHQKTDNNQIPTKEPTPISAPKQKQPISVTPKLKPETSTRRTPPVMPHQPSWLEKGIKKAWDWLIGGNSVARVGVLILFFGVSFLLKYAADNDMLPAELRLAAAAIGSIVLLVLGWRLKDKNQDYGLLLQGAGIGMLYLTAFSTYYLYHFISVGFAFGLLVLISAFATALAVLQNSLTLALAGFIGGYLTPVMVSTGTNNYIALFSYYALLNTAVASIAWFKSWRLLNVMAFGFTFIVSTVWGVLSYLPINFNSTEPFLIIFFLQFLLIAILFAIRQPPNLKGYIDGTLIFGTPIIAFGLQLKLVQPFEYGAAISSLVMGSFYVVLAVIIYKRLQDSLRLLAEVFLAIGVIFLSLAIPFAVDPNITAATWALEGAGLYWVGVRQQRLLVRVFALLLQVGAAIFFSQQNPLVSESVAFLNSVFMGSAMIAMGAISIAWFSSQEFKGKQKQETELSPLLFSWGMLWWLVAGIVQVNKHFNMLEHPNALLTFLTFTAVIMLLLTRKLNWHYSRYMSWAFIPTLAISALAVVNASSHPAYGWGWFAWIAAFIVSGWVLWEAESEHDTQDTTQDDTNIVQQHTTVFSLLHNITLLGVMLIVTWEGSWQITQHVAFDSGWHMAWLPVITIALLWAIMRARIWPFTQHKERYNDFAGILLALMLVAWNLFGIYSTGNSAPLPWIPVLNVIDIVQIVSIITLFVWWYDYKQDIALPAQEWHHYVLSGLIALAFLWLNVMVMRTVHHWAGISYDLTTLLKSPTVQTAFSILWTITGVAIMLFATHKVWKKLWLGGAALMAIVVIKLFLVDLAASGTVARIISFMIVGVLMVAIGYFAPIPNEKESA
jgi:uncharacterized membrane protein